MGRDLCLLQVKVEVNGGGGAGEILCLLHVRVFACSEWGQQYGSLLPTARGRFALSKGC